MPPHTQRELHATQTRCYFRRISSSVFRSDARTGDRVGGLCKSNGLALEVVGALVGVEELNALVAEDAQVVCCGMCEPSNTKRPFKALGELCARVGAANRSKIVGSERV